MATGVEALLRCVFEGCIAFSDADIERRPYHRNCGCALHGKLCSGKVLKEAYGLLHGCRVARGASSVTNLLFANDCYLFFNAMDNKTDCILHVLHQYAQASRQSINMRKSTFMFSANVNVAIRNSLANKLSVSQVESQDHYLGLPSFIGKNKKMVFSFIRDKIGRWLQGWNKKILSQAGKEILLKTVAQAIPAYVMSVYFIPLNLCDALEKMMNSFWWGSKSNDNGGINWMQWSPLCVRRDCGGLGFRRLRDFNLAMLGQQGWRFLPVSNSLTSRVFKAHYFPYGSFLMQILGITLASFDEAFLLRKTY
ncbi:uncharacterized protein LOC120278451 [Dioscorea cayenensis subsp. rotundata]|uniref:Uncharacterized protein LOC120278451 n=1 Tax=Dioscorea cayennensis subsp. rotundata TaxID=55577 RepID=A0AB40CSY2_DIOCR|nr:uncharacterized protein LOC120278451 [Dioscorea cayenensis subsp. rotundata]